MSDPTTSESKFDKDFNDTASGTRVDASSGNTGSRYSLHRKVFRKISQPISDKDDRDAAIVKVILAENEDLRNQVRNLEGFRENFYKCEKEIGIHKEREKKGRVNDMFYDFIISASGLMTAFATWDYNNIKPNNFIILGIALLFIGGSITIRRLDKK